MASEISTKSNLKRTKKNEKPNSSTVSSSLKRKKSAIEADDSVATAKSLKKVKNADGSESLKATSGGRNKGGELVKVGGIKDNEESALKKSRKTVSLAKEVQEIKTGEKQSESSQVTRKVLPSKKSKVPSPVQKLNESDDGDISSPEKPLHKVVAIKKRPPLAPNSTSSSDQGEDEDDAGGAHEDEDDSDNDDHLHGFSTDDDDSSDEDVMVDETPLDIDKLPTIAKDDAAVKRKLDKAKKQPTEDRGVLFIGRLPHGFFEDQMRGYFSQFGTVTRLRLSRNKKTGKSKHYGFVEFDSSSVAQIVAETMDNYLLMGHILRCKVIPKHKVHPELWVGANRKWRAVPHHRVTMMQHNKLRTEDEQKRASKRLLKRQNEKRKKLKEAGIKYSFDRVGYKMGK